MFISTLPGEFLLLVPGQHGLQQLQPLLEVGGHRGQGALHQLQPLLQLPVGQGGPGQIMMTVRSCKYLKL